MSARSPLAGALLSAGSMAGGAVLAILPTVALAVSAGLAQRGLMTPQQQGLIANAVTIGLYTGQLLFAWIVESRLSSTGTARRVVVPHAVTAMGLVAGALMAAFPTQGWAIMLAVPLALGCLEVGRGVSVAERRDHREILSSAAVGLGAAAGLGASILAGQSWGFVPVGIGIAAAALVRGRPVGHRASPVVPQIRRWVVADTAITGAALPAINMLTLFLLGPQASVLFAAVSTVTGLLAIPLTFLRLRLLKAHAGRDIVLASSAVVAATVALLILDVTGVFGLLFGAAWQAQSLLAPLLVASAWRAAALATTLPFAALRRAGRAKLLTFLRALVTLITLGLCVLGVLAGALVWVFAGLLASELASAAIYEAAHRRVAGASSWRSDGEARVR
ncbi:MAG: hypothetical protein QM708_10405 [Propioniciclava sp.]|uniref:hypothetical protein n=1 Tax=Propioniciclava sp. TaxID=2038686 RepID=UPI0039E473A2